MTTINDRLERLEDAFANTLPQLVEAVNTVVATQKTIVETQQGILDTQKTIIAALNRQSTDIEIIKGYLG